MQIDRKCITLSDLTSITQKRKDLFEERISRAFRALKDTGKEDRLEKHLCLDCYYWGLGMAGAACSSSTCGVCGCEVHSGSTNVPRVCLDCAKKYNLCRHCGSDIEYKIRRKLPWEKKE